MASLKVKIGEKLFSGAQATIYKFKGLYSEDGQQTDLGVEDGGLCVKIMASTLCDRKVDGDLVSDDQLVDQEELEATVLAAEDSTSLCHAGIIPYLIVEMSPTRHLVKFVMPLYPCDLLKWLASRGSSVPETSLLHIAEQLASAVQYLHTQKIWHLDLSLRNVLVDSLTSDTPNCVLIDMETSTLGGRLPSKFFTYEFSPPERPHLDKITEKSDVWSLGMVFFTVGARHDTPGIVDDVPELGAVTMNHSQLTPTRIASVVRRDLKHCECLVSLVTMMLNHDPLTRPSMSYVLDNIKALRRNRDASLLFPYVCGPFELHGLSQPEVHSVQLHHGSNMYDLHASCYKCQQVRSTGPKNRTDCHNGDLHLPGHMSLFKAGVILPGCEAEAQKVLADPTAISSHGVGTYFCYPMQCDASALPLSLSDALQLQGGFAVTMNGLETGCPLVMFILCAKSFSAMNQTGVDSNPIELYFTAAQPWPSVCTSTLAQQGRIHTEVPSMLGHARHFCWILPGESFPLANGEIWIPAQDGGFVFWFGSDPLVPNEMDRFFAVAPPAPQSKTHHAPKAEATSGFSSSTVGKLMNDIGSKLQGTLKSLMVPHPKTSSSHLSLPSQSATPNLVVFAQVFSAANIRVELDGKSPPQSFQIPLTGERGVCSGTTYLSPQKVGSLLGAPRSTKHYVFCSCQLPLSSPQATTSSSSTATSSSLIFPQHGFLLLDSRFQVVGIMPLRITTSQAATDFLELHSGSKHFRLTLINAPSSTTYRGTLPPGELREVDTSLLSPLQQNAANKDAFPSPNNSSQSLGSRKSTESWDNTIMSGGIGWMGFSSTEYCFFFSDETQQSWLIRKWHL